MAERSAAEIAAHIRNARKAADLTQAEVAAALRLDRSAISRVEGGERGLAVGELAALARLLDLTVDDILFDEVPEEILLRAEDDQHATAATVLTDELIQDYLYVDALVGD
jgi:transcriptional regulator with XRE-family HTH domain